MAQPAVVSSECPEFGKTLPKIVKAEFGKLESGEVVHKFTITNANNNAQATFIEFGARWIEMIYADKNGHKDNVLVAYDDLAGNIKDDCYLGATTGRYGMRIANASFKLDGKEYKLDENRPGVSLHGGKNAFDKKLWKGHILPTGVLFQRISEDGENGFPGRLLCSVLYQLNDNNEVLIDITAEFVDGEKAERKAGESGKGDADDKKPTATVVNIFNHAYFNLSGKPESSKVYDHKVAIHSNTAAKWSKEVSGIPEDLVALGKLPKLFDLRHLDLHLTEELQNRDELKGGKGWDTSYLLQAVDAARSSKKDVELKHAATVVHPPTGRTLEVYTTQPFVHLYGGGFLDERTTGGRVFGQHAGLCLETCNAGNAPNDNKLPSSVLREGESYAHRTIYQFGLEKETQG